MALELAGWENFYVIVGSSAGALIGLMFVVIALISSRRTPAFSSAVRAFASPTIVYFSSVLLLSGLLSIPRHTRTSLGLLVLGVGVAGFGYVIRVTTHMRRQDHYSPDRGDWIWSVWLPVVAYGCVVAAGAMVQRMPIASLNVVASGVMLLLLIGIHNAWDSAVYMVANAPGDQQ